MSSWASPALSPFCHPERAAATRGPYHRRGIERELKNRSFSKNVILGEPTFLPFVIPSKRQRRRDPYHRRGIEGELGTRHFSCQASELHCFTQVAEFKLNKHRAKWRVCP